MSLPDSEAMDMPFSLATLSDEIFASIWLFGSRSIRDRLGTNRYRRRRSVDRSICSSLFELVGRYAKQKRLFLSVGTSKIWHGSRVTREPLA
jgi:hypothetical protein